MLGTWALVLGGQWPRQGFDSPIRSGTDQPGSSPGHVLNFFELLGGVALECDCYARGARWGGKVMSDVEMLEGAVDDLESTVVHLEARVVVLERRYRELEDRMAHTANKMTIWAAQQEINGRQAKS